MSGHGYPVDVCPSVSVSASTSMDPSVGAGQSVDPSVSVGLSVAAGPCPESPRGGRRRPQEERGTVLSLLWEYLLDGGEARSSEKPAGCAVLSGSASSLGRGWRSSSGSEPIQG